MIMVLCCSFLVIKKDSNEFLSYTSISFPNHIKPTSYIDLFAEVDPPVVLDTTICKGESVIIAPGGCPIVSTVDSVLFEDFEDAKVEYSSSIPEVSDNAQDYWIRTNGSDITNESFIDVQGMFYFAAQDIDATPEPNVDTAKLTFSNINIDGLSSLEFSFFLAEDDNGSNENWDPEDFVHMYYSVDGGTRQNLLWVESESATNINNIPRIDSNFDGVGDANEITDTFVQYTRSISSTGNLMTLVIEVSLNDGNTDIAFDNVTISGRRLSSDPMCSFNFYSLLPTATDTMRIARDVSSYEFTGLTSDTTVYISKVEEGCESMIIPMTITIADTTSTIIDSMICMGDMIEFNDLMITDPGSYRDTLQNVAMCDSFITLNVTVNDLPNLNAIPDTLCQGSDAAIDLTTYESDITSETGSFRYSKRELIRPTELFISEYIEGSSDNKCIEIFNGTNSSRDLSTYSVEIIKPDAGNRQISLSGMLLPDSVFVICDNGTTIYSNADQIETQFDYSGDDAIVLLNGTDSIDIIGQVNIDPGSQWGSGDQSTQNNTIVRNPDILMGDPDGSNSFEPSVEWMGFTQDYIDDLGQHTIDRTYNKTPVTNAIVDVSNGDEFCVVFTDMTTGCIDSTIISFVVKDTSSTVIDSMICEGEMVEFNDLMILTSGTYRDTLENAVMCDSFITLNVTVIDTSTTMIDSTICMGELIEFNDQMISTAGTYRDTLQNAMMCDSFITLSVIVLDTSTTLINSTICFGEIIEFNDQMISSAGTYRDTLTNAAMCDSFINLVVTVNPLPVLNEVRDTFCQDENVSIDLTDYENDITTAAGSFSYSKRETTRPTELFISEYVEGSINNKCIEIYNGTGSTVDLTDYSLEIIKPGSTSDESIDLSGMIDDGSVFVICNSNVTIYGSADQSSGVMTYNGDDAIVLLNGVDTVDIIGQVNVDPGSQWGSGLTSTENNTLVRNTDILTGDTDGSDAFNPALEWIGLAEDDVTDLGRHTINLPVMKTATATIVDVSNGDEFCVVFTDMTTGCIDSTIISFMVKDTSSTVINSMICEGEMVEFNDLMILTSGTYRDTLENAVMCDSFITLNVTVIDTSTTMIDSTICMGELIEFNDQMISTAGTYRDTLQNAAMCDSFITLSVIVEECLDCDLNLTLDDENCSPNGDVTLDLDLSVISQLSDSFIVVLDSVPFDTIDYDDLMSGQFSINVGSVAGDDIEIVVYDKASEFGGLELTEVLADPPAGPNGDANQDGVSNSGQDEFIEMINTSLTPINIGGYELYVGNTLEHTFVDTIIPSGGIVVLFSGGDISNLSQTNASFFLNVSALQLVNSGDEITLLNDLGEEVFKFSYGPEGGNDESLVNDGSGQLVRISETSSTDLFNPGINNPALVTIVEPTGICTDTLNLTLDNCPVLDVALTKMLSSGQPEIFNPGDLVSFDITVYNQGGVKAYDIAIRDYVPAELSYEPALNDSKWGVVTTYRSIDSLDVGADTTIQIFLTVKDGLTTGPIINTAEIIFASYEPNGPLAVDEDDNLEDVGGGREIDDNIDDLSGNSNPDLVNDQDDFDLAQLRLCNSIRFTAPAVDDIAICDTEFSGIVTVNPVAEQLPAELFFSEYIEGPSGLNNKCLEIYNGTGQTINLFDYTIDLYNTDPRLDPDRSLNLTGVLADGDVLVLCNNTTFSTEADIVDPNIIAFNGNDIVTLSKNGVIVDAIGQIGMDPGAQWVSNGVSTMDQTLRRKPTIIEGDRNPDDLFITDAEWISLGDNVNDASGLGTHSISAPAIYNFTFYDADPLSGGNILAENVAAFDTMVAFANSPITLWVATNPSGTTCFSNAQPVTIAVHSSSSSMTCLAEVNLNVDSSCSIIDLPVSSYYRGDIHPLFLTVQYRTENGVLIDPTDVSAYRGERLTYEVKDTCSQALCWGYVNIESKNIPEPLLIQSDTICCTDDVTGAIRLTTDQVLDSLESICYAPITSIIEEFTETVSDLCDTSITEVRYYADFIIKDVKERHLVYAQDIYTLPIPIDSIISPGSSNFLDSLALIDTILLQACGQMDLTPSNVAHYWAERVDPEDANDNGDMEGIPYAYPYLLKDSIVVMDTTTTISEVDVIIEDSLVMIDGIWTVLDVIDHTYDTTTTISTRVIYDYQKISPDRTCNINVKYADHSKDSCYPDGKIFRKWTLIDWCSKEVRELEQWIIVDDIEPPVFGVLPVDIVLLGFDSAIVNGLDTVPIDSIGSLVNVDELFEIIYVGDGFECDADLDMPQFSKLEDNCTAIKELEFNYLLSGFPAEVSADGQTIKNIPAGVNELTIIASDACGNSAEHIMTIIVLDQAPPIARCKEQIRVSYIHDGGSFNRLPLEIIDDGSYDVCGEIILRLGKRLDNKIFCEGSILTFIGTEYIEYCCEDIGNEIPVELTVFDNFGNTAVCTTKVLVEDKSVSEVYCQELWLDCDDIPTREQLLDVLNLRLSNCATEDITFDDIMGSGSCGGASQFVGVYLGGDKVCDLQVHYNTGQIFDPLSIKWPVHRDGSFGNGTIRECMDQDGLRQISSTTDRIDHHDALICDDAYDLTNPSWCESQCNLIGLSYEMSSVIQSSTCKNDIIDWTIIDWCVYMPQQVDRNDDQLELVDDYWLDQSDAKSQGLWLAQLEDGDSCMTCERYTSFPESIYYRFSDVEQDGYYSYRQIIRVSDQTQPIITTIGNDSTIVLNPELCTYSSSITARAADYCDYELNLDSNLSWKVLIVGLDVNLDQTIEDSIHYIGNELRVDLSGDANIVFYDIEWVVTDACGNTARSLSNVQLIDESINAPICISSISLGVINDRIVLDAQDLSISAIEDCDEVSILGLSLDHSNESIQEQLQLECTDVTGSDSISLRLWVQDSNGNRNYCLITVFYQPSDNCSESSRSISGLIHSIFNQSMAQVEVNLIDDKEDILATVLTDELGDYKLPPPPSDVAYLRVDKPIHSLDGVSTLDIILLQHHILGINSIKNPYLQWAGDINQDGRLSGIDISLMKKALLGIDDNTEAGKWKFMDATTSMIELPNDLTQSKLNQIIYHTNRDKYNFLGAKTGDVSGDSYDRNKRSNVIATVPIPYEYYYDPIELSYMLELTLNLEGGLAAIEMHVKGEHYSGIDFTLRQDPLHDDDLYRDIEGTKLIWINSNLDDQSDCSMRIKLNTNRAVQNEKLDELLQNINFSLWDYDYTEYQGALKQTSELQDVDVIISPNPFIDQAILSINGLEGYPYELMIINAAGQIVNQFAADHKEFRTVHRLSKEDLNEPGVYYYQLKMNNTYQVGQFIMSN